MKRSEMLLILENLIRNTDTICFERGVAVGDLSIEILNTIEKAGMLPPKAKFKMKKSEPIFAGPGDGYLGEKKIKKIIHKFKWEPEGE